MPILGNSEYGVNILSKTVLHVLRGLKNFSFFFMTDRIYIHVYIYVKRCFNVAATFVSNEHTVIIEHLNTLLQRCENVGYYSLWCRHTITIRPAHAQRFENFTKYFDKLEHVQIFRDL